MDGIDFVPGEGGGLCWEPFDSADPRAAMLLGIDDAGTPHFVREPAPGQRIDARSRTVMRLLPLLSGEEAALYGGARSLVDWRSEEHTSELQSLIRISYADFCLQKETQVEVTIFILR